MRRGTKLMLLAGCALVLVLEGPRTLATLPSGWRGPYVGRAVTTQPLSVAASLAVHAAEGVAFVRH